MECADIGGQRRPCSIWRKNKLALTAADQDHIDFAFIRFNVAGRRKCAFVAGNRPAVLDDFLVAVRGFHSGSDDQYISVPEGLAFGVAAVHYVLGGLPIEVIGKVGNRGCLSYSLHRVNIHNNAVLFNRPGDKVGSFEAGEFAFLLNHAPPPGKIRFRSGRLSENTTSGEQRNREQGLTVWARHLFLNYKYYEQNQHDGEDRKNAEQDHKLLVPGDIRCGRKSWVRDLYGRRIRQRTCRDL